MLYSQDEPTFSEQSYRPHTNISSAAKKSVSNHTNNFKHEASVITLNNKKSVSNSLQSNKSQKNITFQEIMRITDERLKNKGKREALNYLQQKCQEYVHLYPNDSNYASLYFTCAILAHELKQFPKAQGYYEDVIDNLSDDKTQESYKYQALMGLSCLYQDTEQYTNSQIILLQMINSYPNEAAPLFNLGNIYKIMGNFKKALQCYKKCIKLCKHKHINNQLVNPPSDNPEADCLHNSAVILSLIDQIQEAKQIYKIISKKFNKRLSSQLNLCQILYSNYSSISYCDEAEQILKTVSGHVRQYKLGSSQVVSVLHHKANIKKKLGNYTQSRKFYKKCFDIGKIQSKQTMYCRIMIDYCELCAVVEEYGRAAEQYNKLMKKYSNNPIVIINCLIMNQISDMLQKTEQLRKLGKLHPILSISQQNLQMLNRIDNIFYPSNVDLNLHKKSVKNQLKIVQSYKKNYEQNKLILGLQQLQQNQQRKYDQSLANTHSIKLSKMKIIRYFINYWIPIIFQSIKVLQLLQNSDKNIQIVMKQLVKLTSKDSQKSIKQINEIQTNNSLRPRRKNTNKNDNIIPDISGIYQKTQIIPQKSISSVGQQYPSLRYKNKVKQENYVKSEINDLKDQLYMITKKFWVMAAHLMLEKSSPNSEEVHSKSFMKNNKILDDLPQRHKILKRVNSDSSLIFFEKKTSEQQNRSQYQQKLRAMNQVMTYLQNLLKNNQIINILLCKIQSTQQSQKFIKNSFDSKNNQSAHQQKSKKLFLSPDFIQENYQSYLYTSQKKNNMLISFGGQSSNKTQNISTPQQFIYHKKKKIAADLLWQVQIYEQTLTYYRLKPNQCEQKGQLLVKTIKKLGWLMLNIFYDIMLKCETRLKGKQTTDITYNEIQIGDQGKQVFYSLNFCSFFDKTSFLTEIGNIPHTSCLRDITIYISKIASENMKISSNGVIQETKFLLNKKFEENANNSDYSQKQKYIVSIVFTALIQTFNDQGIKKIFKQWAISASPNLLYYKNGNENDHRKQSNQVQLFKSFSHDKQGTTLTKLPSLLAPSPELYTNQNRNSIDYEAASISTKQALRIFGLLLVDMIQTSKQQQKQPLRVIVTDLLKNILKKQLNKTIKSQTYLNYEQDGELSKNNILPQIIENSQSQNRRQTQMPKQVQGKWACPQFNRGSNKCILM